MPSYTQEKQKESNSERLKLDKGKPFAREKKAI